MTNLIRIATVLGVTASALAAPAAAQDTGPYAAAPVTAQDAGPYVVARAGVAVDSDLKFRDRDRTAPSTYPENVDFKPGFTGEVGGGYDFGAFRVEGTIGYSQVKLDRKRAGAGFADDGRVRALNLGVSGYFDIPTGSAVTPYVGGGVGASRVDARLARVGATPTAVSSFRDKDWGFQWHVDAGVGIKAAERTTVELGARYTRTSALRFDGANGAAATEFEPRLASTSVMLGIRQGF